MDIIIEHTIFLFIVAILVALIAHRLKLPYMVGLVVTGILLSFSHVRIGLSLTHDFIFDVILPPLLFEAAINIHWKELRRDMLPILILAIFGVIISAAFVGYGMVYFLEWQWLPSLIFGVIIAATDPVAVIAMFKDMNMKGRVRLLVESESLFNDGVAAVLFTVVLSLAAGSESISTMTVAQSLALIVAGGIIIGAICGIVAILLAGRITDHLLETALTTVVAYGSFFLAEHLHISGVLATLSAGLIMGNIGNANNTLSERGRNFICDFWEFIAFLANSLVFLLIGLRVAAISFPVLGIIPLVIIVILILVGRALSIYPLCMLFMRTRWAIPLRQQHVLWWGGLRGALALALALSLPDTLAMHDQIVTAIFGVVVFSVVIQGLTMPLLLRNQKNSL